jgi:chemotaxis protein methyltransferase CheR
VLDPSRDYLFDTRLTKLLRNQGMAHLEELVQTSRLREESGLERSIAEAMTINETSFFRDSRPFELLRTELLPKLIERAATTGALCASGARPAPPARRPTAWAC